VEMQEFEKKSTMIPVRYILENKSTKVNTKYIPCSRHQGFISCCMRDPAFHLLFHWGKEKADRCTLRYINTVTSSNIQFQIITVSA